MTNAEKEIERFPRYALPASRIMPPPNVMAAKFGNQILPHGCLINDILHRRRVQAYLADRWRRQQHIRDHNRGVSAYLHHKRMAESYHIQAQIDKEFDDILGEGED